ncbi:MAG: M23 family metallopeptidase [Cyanobacteria bacterium P01_D01_bin.115]
MLRKTIVVVPLVFTFFQPASAFAESWWHYGFAVGIGPLKLQLVRPAKDAAQEFLGRDVDYRPVEKGDTIAGYPVTSGFGPRPSPCHGCSSDHGGVDLGTPTGTPLHAAVKAKVTCFWDDGGGGLVADIWYGPENYRALHLDKCDQGTYAPGEVFAKTGNTGNGTGEHLDWRQQVDGQWVKPTKGVLEATLSGSPLAPPVVASASLAQSVSLTDNDLKCAIGAAEGTKNDDCSPNHNYWGHIDPGNGVANLGAFSYQHGARSPEEADQKQLSRLRNAEQEIQAQATGKFGRSLSKAALASALDLWNQAPLAGQDFVRHLPTADPTPQQIIDARARSYIDPSTGALDAPGLGNDIGRVKADQERRTKEVLGQVQ